MKKLVSLSLLAILLISCGGKESYEELDAVTGIYLFDINGSIIGDWNVPNDNRRDYTVYPNPSDGNVSLFIPSRTGAKPKAIWVVPGKCEASDDNDILTADIEFSVDEIQNASVLSDINLDHITSNVQLALTSLSEGFYKVFFQDENDGVYWQNIFISPGTLNFPDNSLLDAVCE